MLNKDVETALRAAHRRLIHVRWFVWPVSLLVSEHGVAGEVGPFDDLPQRIEQALKHGEETTDGGVSIVCHWAFDDAGRLVFGEAMQGKLEFEERVVEWWELSERAGELVGLVDEVALAAARRGLIGQPNGARRLEIVERQLAPPLPVPED